MAIKEKFIQIAENEQKVYEAGKEAEYNAFWDSYQQNGKIYSAAYQFASPGWTDETFKPKHSQLNMTNCGNMFNTCGVTDLQGILDKQGVVFDFSKCTAFNNTFAYSKITHLGVIDTTSCYNLASTFGYTSDLHTIDKIVIKEGSTTFNNTFINCEGLIEVRFEGIIGKSLDIQYSTKLSAESINNIFSCLSNSVTGQVLTLPTTAEATYNAKFGANAYATKVNSKSNWEIKTA